MEQVVRFIIYLVTLLAVIILSAYVFAIGANAQSLDSGLRPDFNRVRMLKDQGTGKGRNGGYQSERAGKPTRSRSQLRAESAPARVDSGIQATLAAAAITPGTPLSKILHTSQFSLTSSAGTDEQFADHNNDLIAEERTTFDSLGGTFDIAVGLSGTRYGVYSATSNQTLVGVLLLGFDTNGDYILDSSATYNLQRDFSLPSAAAVVTGTSKAGREFVIVCSSGYFNSSNPNDPNNEPSPGVILLVRDTVGNGFDDSLTRTLVQLGDNRLYNANAMALLPNNDLLIADFHSDELRVIRDTNADGLPDTLDNVPYYDYRFSDDAPLDLAVNSRGVVFSHSSGNDTLMLAIFDDDGDGDGDRDEVVVEGLSIDNNLFLHGLTTDRLGNVYAIEDAMGTGDGTGGNGGRPQVDAFPDGQMNGVLQNGKIFTLADSSNLALSGLSFASVINPINDARQFVRQHYLDFLGRDPDQGGLDYWSSQITGCANDRCVNSRRIGVSAAFFIELEFQDTGSFVYRLYKAALGRRPTFAEFSADRATVVAGPNLEANKQALANDFVTRQEFLQRYPLSQTAEQFVNKLFDTAGLIPFTSDRQRLINDMQGGKTRAQVLREVVEFTDFKTREYNPSFVLMQYFGYLRREPDQGGYDFWLNVLNNQQPNNYRGMVCSFITSREYQERFGLLLRRTNTDCAE
jgi:hypothetical protein